LQLDCRTAYPLRSSHQPQDRHATIKLSSIVSKDTLADVRAEAASAYASSIYRNFSVQIMCLPPAEELAGVMNVTLKGDCDLAGSLAETETAAIVVLDSNVLHACEAAGDLVQRWRLSMADRTTAASKLAINRFFEVAGSGSVTSTGLAERAHGGGRGHMQAVDMTKGLEAAIEHLQAIVARMEKVQETEASETMLVLHLVLFFSSRATLPSMASKSWDTLQQLTSQDLASVNAELQLHCLCATEDLADHCREQFGQLDYGVGFAPLVVHVDFSAPEALEPSLQATANTASGKQVPLKVRIEAPKQQGSFTHTLLVNAEELVRRCACLILSSFVPLGSKIGFGKR
jgi:hypothetical protein